MTLLSFPCVPGTPSRGRCETTERTQANQEHFLRLGNSSKQKPSAKSGAVKCYQLRRQNNQLRIMGNNKPETTLGKLSYICLKTVHVHVAHLSDSPVSSDLPLLNLKEFKWLPSCLYFLNLGGGNNGVVIHLAYPCMHT